VTVDLTNRHGYVLYQAGEYREATMVLKKALERTTAAFGESGGEAFEINMYIGYTYSMWSFNLSNRIKHFDRALEILRERGQHESIKYVTTLVRIVVNLIDNDGLKGSYSVDAGGLFDDLETWNNFSSLDHEYSNYFHKAEKYVLEAIELSEKLGSEDEYLAAKIAILQAQLNVMDTADLAAVSGGVEGRIARGTARDNYDREEERLTTAIDNLSQDAEINRAFLDAANKLLLDIAWLDKDEQRLRSMCTSGTVNSVDDFPPERLYEIMEGGMVFAPDIGIRISTNIFKQRRSIGRQAVDENGKPVKKPYFKPVCVDGHLMAALIHAPRVTVEEIR